MALETQVQWSAITNSVVSIHQHTGQYSLTHWSVFINTLVSVHQHTGQYSSTHCHGWADCFRSMKLQHIKCVCPNAPINSVTLNAGMKMPSWFDIIGLSPDSPEDEEGIKSSSEILKKLIEDEEKEGIPANRIVIGGFSQGGAVALHRALSDDKKLAGVLALSTWLPLHRKLDKVKKSNVIKDMSIFQGHGTEDPLVPFQWGEITSKVLASMCDNHSFHNYPMVHTSCPQELADVKKFLETLLP
ncbi:acyl-protein thioesterase 1-like isoform X1 [Ostrea edulis]|uniref:acyl-protein thioesterase 1-like isoform X1 n=1 Tax=Ostrea edulis TaxID=37623 RepID=UPI0024AF33C4|nr:acyl-protein thioesterase 1-like isoform X1 [Ostrea edulis]